MYNLKRDTALAIYTEPVIAEINASLNRIYFQICALLIMIKQSRLLFTNCTGNNAVVNGSIN